MVPGMTERDALAADQRRREWLAAALREPTVPDRAGRHGPLGPGPLRRAGGALRHLLERRRAARPGAAPATPAGFAAGLVASPLGHHRPGPPGEPGVDRVGSAPTSTVSIAAPAVPVRR